VPTLHDERKRLIARYLWDDKSGFFFDYNLLTGRKRGM
jgi:neutral trehalase